ncbi:CarD family transcriptional regulator [Ornithinimicrobium sufpigmenti]|uniref:CarD family transcriptional regulator n=1 Tax=Ornithinimicrobium sufpigmenti TaxID=2508882 RepID=UPI0015E1A8F9|nr:MULTISPECIES: CarD family transcriptional regulator [unclassified Ornithinimicrobium]
MQLVHDQIVVHPHHGPARVAGFTERELRGRLLRYVRLEVEGSSLTIAVPLGSVEEVGVREPMCREELDDLFGVLTAPGARQEKQWARRIKDEVQRLRTGDVLTIAGVVRDLVRRREERGLSLGERDLLRDARRPLISELVGCLRMSGEQCDSVVEEAVLDGVVPAVPLQLAEAS